MSKDMTIAQNIHTNENGLTYLEWLRASGMPFKGDWPAVSRPMLQQAMRAWELGEDPSDYRAEGTFSTVK